MKYPGLSRRKSGYQLRKRLPEDVRQLMASNPSLWLSLSMNPGAPLHNWQRLCDRHGNVSAEVTRSLGEGTAKTIAGKYHLAAAEVEEFFAFVRRAFQPFTEIPSDEKLRALASRHRNAADQDASARYSNIGMTTRDREDAAENLRDDMATYGVEDDPVVVAGYLGEAGDLLRGSRVSSDEPGLGILAGYLRDGHLEVLSRTLERAEGRGRELTDTPPKADMANAPQSITLGKAFARYVRVKTEVVS